MPGGEALAMEPVEEENNTIQLKLRGSFRQSMAEGDVQRGSLLFVGLSCLWRKG